MPVYRYPCRVLEINEPDRVGCKDLIDLRIAQAIRIMQARALMRGREECVTHALEVLPQLFWERPGSDSQSQVPGALVGLGIIEKILTYQEMEGVD